MMDLLIANDSDFYIVECDESIWTCQNLYRFQSLFELQASSSGFINQYFKPLLKLLNERTLRKLQF